MFLWIERVVAKQLIRYTKTTNHMEPYQSAYREHFLSTILVSLTPASNGLKFTLLEEISEWLSQTVMEFMPNPPNEHLDRVYPKEVSLDQLSSISSSVRLEKYVANMEYHS